MVKHNVKLLLLSHWWSKWLWQMHTSYNTPPHRSIYTSIYRSIVYYLFVSLKYISFTLSLTFTLNRWRLLFNRILRAVIMKLYIHVHCAMHKLYDNRMESNGKKTHSVPPWMRMRMRAIKRITSRNKIKREKNRKPRNVSPIQLNCTLKLINLISRINQMKLYSLNVNGKKRASFQEVRRVWQRHWRSIQFPASCGHRQFFFCLRRLKCLIRLGINRMPIDRPQFGGAGILPFVVIHFPNGWMWIDGYWLKT